MAPLSSVLQRSRIRAARADSCKNKKIKQEEAEGAEPGKVANSAPSATSCSKIFGSGYAGLCFIRVPSVAHLFRALVGHVTAMRSRRKARLGKSDSGTRRLSETLSIHVIHDALFLRIVKALQPATAKSPSRTDEGSGTGGTQ